MELSEILDSLSGSNMEKTASSNGSTNATLSSAIDRALGSTDAFEKTAGYSSNPSNDLIKIAQDISNAETNALVKEAHIYGRAVADGFAARMSQYSGNGSTYSSGHSADTVKEAMELGYIHASNALSNSSTPSYGYTKTASDNYTVKLAHAKGAEDAVKTASFLKGQEDAVKTASYIKGQEDAVKTASFFRGQEDAVKTARVFSKIATDYSNFGFKVGNSVLKRLGR